MRNDTATTTNPIEPKTFAEILEDFTYWIIVKFWITLEQLNKPMTVGNFHAHSTALPSITLSNNFEQHSGYYKHLNYFLDEIASINKLHKGKQNKLGEDKLKTEREILKRINALRDQVGLDQQFFIPDSLKKITAKYIQNNKAQVFWQSTATSLPEDLRDFVENIKEDDSKFPTSFINNDEILKILLLISQCKPIYDASQSRNHALLINIACKLGNATIVGQLFSLEMPPLFNPIEYSMLHLAAMHGHLEVAELLIQSQDPNALVNLVTPLHLAAQNGHIDLCKFLIIHGALTDPLSPESKTPLYFASQKGHGKVITLLIEHGADLTITDNSPNKWNSLHIACAEGQFSAVRALISSIKYQVEHEQEIIKEIEDEKRKETIIEVIKNIKTTFYPEGKFFVDCQDRNLKTPLHLACKAEDFNSSSYIKSQNSKNLYSSRIKIVELLLSDNADVNTLDKEESTPLIAASQARFYPVIKLLVAKGANVNFLYKDIPALFYLEMSFLNPQTIALTRFFPSAKDHQDCLQFLLEKTNKDLHVTLSGDTLLHQAAGMGDWETLKFLVEIQKMDVNAANQLGQTPLYMAVKRDHLLCVQYLMLKGADVNAVTLEEKDSILHIAALRGNAQMAELLLGKNANVNAVNKKGVTPILLTDKNKISKIFFKHGATLDFNDEITQKYAEVIQELKSQKELYDFERTEIAVLQETVTAQGNTITQLQGELGMLKKVVENLQAQLKNVTINEASPIMKP